jgi:hypothetical protein
MISFDPTGTLLLRRSIPSLFMAGLSIREMKEGTKRFYNNVNSKKLKSIEDSERSSADSRSRKDRGKVIPT